MEASGRVRHRVLPLDEIPEGGGVLVEIGERDIGIFKVDGELRAYENRCLHQGGPVCTGTILGRTRLILNDVGEVLAEVDDDGEKRLVCPWHGWEYDLATGELAHDRRYRLRRHEVLVEDGIVYVEA
jgi:nitrite reductase/ring-hydroxylating ferredoxin subunit